jgi:hypothetical protein
MDSALKHEHHSRAARLRWASPGMRRRVAERAARRLLKRDLVTLAFVMRVIRNKLEFPEKNRQKALIAHHLPANKDRRMKRNLRRALEGSFRRAIHRENIRRDRELNRLERVARVVFKRQAHRKLIKSLRSRLEAAMKYTTNKSQKARELVGCSLFELRQYLEKQFKPGMTWENHSYIGWHIDHIKPLAKFNLHDPEQQRIAFHFSNLQPLWAKENIAKGVS